MMAIVYILSLPTTVYGANNNVTQENVTTNVTITNSVPIISEVTLKDVEGTGTMDLSPNTSVVINCSGRAFDKDGASELTGSGAYINATLFDSTSNPDTVANFSTHYKNGSCTITNPDSDATNVSFECRFNVFFVANPDTWTCNATPVDTNAAVGVGLIDTETMGVLTAVDISDSIDFGDLSVDSDTGTTDTTSIVYNEGNIIFDINLVGFANASNVTKVNGDGPNNSMRCGTNKINDTHIRYSLSTGQSWSSQKIQVNVTGLDDSAFSLTENNTAEDQTVDPLPSYKNVYWGFGVPKTPIVKGECSGFVQFTAIVDT